LKQKKHTAKEPKNIAGRVAEFSKPVVEELGYRLWDVTFEKIGTLYELTIFIERDPEVISLDDCEAVSRAVDPLLDRYDPISEQYTFYVSSAGLDRELKTAEHFQRFMGHTVDVKLFRAVDGAKHHTGTLTAYEADGSITIGTTSPITFAPGDVACVRLALSDADLAANSDTEL